MAASGRTTMRAPFCAASRMSSVSLALFAAVLPRSEEHWTAATRTVSGIELEEASTGCVGKALLAISVLATRTTAANRKTVIVIIGEVREAQRYGTHLFCSRV